MVGDQLERVHSRRSGEAAFAREMRFRARRFHQEDSRRASDDWTYGLAMPAETIIGIMEMVARVWNFRGDRGGRVSPVDFDMSGKTLPDIY